MNHHVSRPVRLLLLLAGVLGLAFPATAQRVAPAQLGAIASSGGQVSAQPGARAVRNPPTASSRSTTDSSHIAPQPAALPEQAAVAASRHLIGTVHTRSADLRTAETPTPRGRGPPLTTSS